MASREETIPFEETCIMCPKRGKRCAGCMDALYCSRECQKLDWKLHKKFCKQPLKPRPSSKHRKALFFPGGLEQPKLVWVLYSNSNILTTTKTFFKNRGIELMSGFYNKSQKRFVSDDVHIEDICFICPSDVWLVEDPRNLAMEALGGDGRCAHPWQGPWLVVHRIYAPQDDGSGEQSEEESEQESKEDESEDEYKKGGYRDLTMRDVRNIADIITSGFS